MTYSKKLKQHFDIDSKGNCKFADGVEYTSSEMQMLMNMTDKGINTVHEVKKLFLGVVVE